VIFVLFCFSHINSYKTRGPAHRLNEILHNCIQNNKPTQKPVPEAGDLLENSQNTQELMKQH
jgi:hypothetical protein